MAPSYSETEDFKTIMRGVSARSPNKTSSISPERPKDLPLASPSASILLISPTNRILLLHRVKTSTAFASAHVFPGGHVSPQDGYVPPVEDPRRHEDSEAYRLAAIRECFEESGLLLAKQSSSPEDLVQLSEQERAEGRKMVHAEDILFAEWVKQRGWVPDLDELIPFTRWLTPANIPKRYSTQMYLYFLPIDSDLSSKTDKAQMHIPTPDGGVEHTAARFLFPSEWLDMALSGEIVLYPPQFFLLKIIADFLLSPPTGKDEFDAEKLREQRRRLMHFVETDGDPPWGEKCISPNPIKKVKGRYMIIGIEDPGPELEGTSRRGDAERVIKVELAQDMERGRHRPSPQKVIWKRDMVDEKEKL